MFGELRLIVLMIRNEKPVRLNLTPTEPVTRLDRVRCDNRAMAVLLVRAIIVENVIARFEDDVI
jgi:hypothetical protein